MPSQTQTKKKKQIQKQTPGCSYFKSKQLTMQLISDTSEYLYTASAKYQYVFN